MRNLLALVGLVVVGFAGVGYYLGWYHFDMSPGKDGKQHISVDVDTKKIGQDAQSGLEKVERGVKDNLKKEGDTEPKTDPKEFVGPPEPQQAKNFFNMTTPTKR